MIGTACVPNPAPALVPAEERGRRFLVAEDMPIPVANACLGHDHCMPDSNEVDWRFVKSGRLVKVWRILLTAPTARRVCSTYDNLGLVTFGAGRH